MPQLREGVTQERVASDIEDIVLEANNIPAYASGPAYGPDLVQKYLGWVDDSFKRLNRLYLDPDVAAPFHSPRWEAITRDGNLMFGFPKILLSEVEHQRDRILALREEPSHQAETPKDVAMVGPGLDLQGLHPEIVAAAAALFAGGHYRNAILDAAIAVESRVRLLSGLADSGSRLMGAAFHLDNGPLLVHSDGQLASDDERRGFMHIFMGVMMGIRNPKAHGLDATGDRQRALEYLALASLLMRRLDETTYREAG